MKEGNQLAEPSNKTKVIFLICWIANVTISFDHGIIPAASKEIKQDLLLKDDDLGFMGTGVYIGLLIGSFPVSQVFKIKNTRKLISLVMAAYSGSLLIVLATDQPLFLLYSRMLVGFLQAFLVLFFPTWVDLHGESKQTIWLKYLQLGVPLGVFLGYISTSLFVKYIYLLLACSLIIFCCFQSSDIDIQKKENNSNQHPYLPRLQHLEPYHNTHKLSQSNIHCMGHIFFIEPTLIAIKNHTYINYISRLTSNKIYACSMMALQVIYFVATGMQFWITDYLREILHVDQQVIFQGICIVLVTAPFLGFTIGGAIFEKLGGQKSPNALSFCLVNGFLTSACAIPIPFLNSFQQVITLIWLVLFLIGSLIPALTGIMLLSIPKNLTSIGQSTGSLFGMFLGNICAPQLYGSLNQLGNPIGSRKGMHLLTGWTIWIVIILTIAWCDKTSQSANQQDERIKLSQGQDSSFLEDHSDQLLSKITEQESEQSASVYGKTDFDEVIPCKKHEQLKGQAFSQASPSLQEDDEEEEQLSDTPIIPITHNEIKKNIQHPLLNKSRKRGSIQSLFCSKPVTYYENDKGRNSTPSIHKHANNHKNNSLEFTKNKLNHFKKMEQTLRNSNQDKFSSLELIAGMLGKSNCIMRIDQEMKCNNKQNLQEVLCGIYQINVIPTKDIEMNELPK